ncbi:MAG: magnesium protoporphyrin IX methyltransferase [Pseudanabaenaceae cyanobacterium SKYG29]|nr:magnesium protoporphyrin IX methyltransferase [Pseudanabaenaceae cyanobacterium SKYG29]
MDKLTRRDNDKEVVKEYFNGVGFERWRRIYGTEPVNSVQADIRLGHQQTIDRVLTWLKEEGSLENISICDVGCGTGSLSLPLAQLGAKVWANDISARMVEVAKSQAVNPDNPQFQVADLEQITGTYDTVICLDVLIHYPLADAQRMIKHLASLSTHRLILSFAPKTLYYAILKKIGSLFPGASKATRAYLHPESAIRQTLAAAGFTVTKDAMQKTKFYFSRLLLAERKT